MGDRVAVMRAGVLQQCDSPKNLYRNPANVFVAGFMGSPKMNLFNSVLRRTDGGLEVQFGPGWVPLSEAAVDGHPTLRGRAEGPIVLGVRPEGVRLAGDEAPGSVRAQALVVEDLGNESLVYFEAPVEKASDGDQRDQAVEEEAADEIVAGAGKSMFIARITPAAELAVGQSARFAIDADQLYFFDPDGTAIN